MMPEMNNAALEEEFAQARPLVLNLRKHTVGSPIGSEACVYLIRVVQLSG
jgi:hypothetical protein